MAEQGVDKPIWGKEMGIPVNPLFPDPDRKIASRFFKKFVGSFGAGAQLCAVTPFVTMLSPLSVAMPGPGLYKSSVSWYQFFNPSASIDDIKKNAGTLMLDTFELLKKHLSGCTAEEYDVNRDAGIFIFSNPDKGTKVIMGWTDNVDDQLYPKDYFDPGNFEFFTVYNHIGEVQAPVIPETLSEEPFMIVLEGDRASYYKPQEDIILPLSSSAGSSGGSSGCSNINALDDPLLINGFLNILIWLSPALYIVWRRRLII